VIPLRDIIPSRTTPFVTVCLIAVNIVVFIYELTLGRAVDAFTRY
jgi:membrane associated rhomboid family serine protease